MSQKRYGVDQIIPMLRRADVELGKGKKVPEVCKLLGIGGQTYVISTKTIPIVANVPVVNASMIMP